IILGGNDVSDVKRGIEVALKELDRTFGDVYGNEAGHIELQYTDKGFFDYDALNAYSMKMTRDAEYDLVHEMESSLMELMSSSLKQ
ncbi:hypothetical protein ONQ62_27000, partial [Salmonella enterica subsp. enterica serovar Virginia]|nr:hypothetical protein [Salmonella enterica subsp. enterica serovar Virginia]